MSSPAQQLAGGTGFEDSLERAIPVRLRHFSLALAEWHRAVDEAQAMRVRFWPMPFVLNRSRKEQWARSRRARLRSIVQAPLVRVGVWCGFTNIDYAYVHGSKERLHLGERCSTMDTLFNVVSGHIYVGDDTAFAHGCQVLTGEHRFFNGKRAEFQADSPFPEVPLEGNDIHIGKRCFVGSGAIILKNVTIGDDVRIGAHSVVNIDVPSGCFAVGIPARVITSSDIP